MEPLRYISKVRCREQRTPNEIRVYKSFCELVLYNVLSEEIGISTFDITDLEKVVGVKWGLSGGYVKRNHLNIQLHNVILPSELDQTVDHRDGNPLNNRKSNLRVATRQQQSCNARGVRSGTGVKGVLWHKQRQRFQAAVWYKRKRTSKWFTDLREAEKWVRKTRELLHGEFTCHD